MVPINPDMGYPSRGEYLQQPVEKTHTRPQNGHQNQLLPLEDGSRHGLQRGGDFLSGQRQIPSHFIRHQHRYLPHQSAELGHTGSLLAHQGKLVLHHRMTDHVKILFHRPTKR